MTPLSMMLARGDDAVSAIQAKGGGNLMRAAHSISKSERSGGQF
jgi:hypothetical protein